MKQAAKLMVVCMMLTGMTGGVVHADLVAHWTLDEMSGNTTGDASGNGLDGTLIGSPEWVPGKLSGAVAFDGVDDYIDFGNPSDLPAGTSARSMTAWVTTDNLDSGWVAAAAYGSPAGSQAFGFARNGSLLSGFGYGNDLTIADFFETETWYHLALCAGRMPVMPQSATPFCSARTTSANAMVTALPPMPSMKSPRVVL